jgi:hypothetical protein
MARDKKQINEEINMGGIMNTQEIIEEIKKIKDTMSQSDLKRYNFELAERIILRLDSLSECNECRTFINEFVSIIGEIKNDSLININKKYTLFIKRVLVHLQKNHKLITKGYYTNTYMALGIGIGLPFGVAFSQLLGQIAYIGIGLPIGVGIGLSIGSKLDTKAKEEGLII